MPDRWTIQRDGKGAAFVDVESAGRTIRLFSQVGDETVLRIRGSGVSSTTVGAPAISTHNLAGIVVADWMSEETAKVAQHHPSARASLFSLIEEIAKQIGGKSPQHVVLDEASIEQLAARFRRGRG